MKSKATMQQNNQIYLQQDPVLQTLYRRFVLLGQRSEQDADPKLRIQPNSFTDWCVAKIKGKDRNIITNFQRYSNEKLTPKFNEET